MLALMVSRGDMDANKVNDKDYTYMEAFVKEFMSDVKVEDKNYMELLIGGDGERKRYDCCQ